MASADITVKVRVADMERMRLLVWELLVLLDRMRIEASPHAESLERVIDRFVDGGDDDRPE